MKKTLKKILIFSLIGFYFLKIDKVQPIVPYYYFPSTKNLQKESLSIGRNAYQLLYFGQFKESLNLAKLAVKLNKKDEKLWLILSEAQIANEQLNDALISLKKAEYGHTLVDLSANIKPNNNTYIRSSIRVRNEYGGFWGSGVTFDLRELYLRGLISNSIRYQIGDMDYKMTPFTFYNNSERFYSNSLDIFGIYNDIIDSAFT